MRNRLVPLALALATTTLPLATTLHAAAEPSGPSTPEALMDLFARSVSERALDRLVALYEEEAVFVPAPGVVHSGRREIRLALAQMLALSPVLETRVEEVHQAGDTALVLVAWTMRGTAPDGSPVSQGGRSADVLRRQADGTWRVLIDHP